MAERRDLAALLAAQQRDQVTGREALAGAGDGAHRLARVLGPVHRLDAVDAQVAIAAGRRGLAEIGEQRPTAAAMRLAQRHQRVEAVHGDPLALLILAFQDMPAAARHVLHAVEGQRIGGQTVAPGAADLLIPALDVLRHVGVADETHVWLVYPHAEGDGGDRDDAVLAQEAVLRGAARPVGQAGVIGHGVVARLAQRLRQLLGAPAGPAIDDAAFALMRGDEARDLAVGAVLRRHRQPDVGAVEPHDEAPGRVVEQARLDVVAGCGVGGGGEGDGLGAAERRPQLAELEIFRAEIVPPLRHAMRLVDGEQADSAALQERRGFRLQQALRRGVEQAQRPVARGAADAPVLARRVVRIDAARRYAHRRQLADLIAHERNQRRHDHGESAPHDGRQLVAQRLAAAGGHDGEDILAGQHGRYDVFLPRPEVLESVDPPHRLPRGGDKRSRVRRAPGPISGASVEQGDGRNARHVIGVHAGREYPVPPPGKNLSPAAAM